MSEARSPSATLSPALAHLQNYDSQSRSIGRTYPSNCDGYADRMFAVADHCAATIFLFLRLSERNSVVIREGPGDVTVD